MAAIEDLALLIGLVGLGPACAREHPAMPESPAADPGDVPAEPAVVEVPYRSVRHQMLIDVRIEGEGPFTFLVDTGVTGAVIDSALAAKLGIELDDDEAQRIEQFGKTLLIHQIWIPELSVGELRLDRLQAAAVPMDMLGSRLGEPLHGILGDGFLGSRATRFDHVERTVSFAPSMEAFAEDVAAADHVMPLVMNASGDMPVVEVALGDKSFRATIDTGSSLGLEIFTPFAEELGLGGAMTEWTQSRVLGGSLGEAIVYDGTVDRLTIGPLELTDVPTSITPPRADPNRKGNLGNRLWEGYVMILDYPGREIVLRKKA
ncbi:retroviral-like aspartic protease family protein [Paraliomyxa miuraensis]|uniref:retroviral-like aspartic protease family protein n=1 Tax=Paraliomyxa miuraensis TaxID=376150 RepID=UPI0022577735|nr:retroviral-like aspartic protease family protein [Paraliomyxa miuraensis]MCX4239913.1 retroviral-like aspartic protease family protein [Paraliomyxa miuraensis]